jgi:hypothetical protein
VKKHIGDRRGRARFEIVGRLIGSLETRERWAIRNMGEGGALVESTVPLAPGGRVAGRLSFRGQSREVRGEARHIATAGARGGGCALSRGRAMGRISQCGRLRQHGANESSAEEIRARGGPPRRGSRGPGTDTEIGQARWSTVGGSTSATGVLLASQQPLDLGETGAARPVGDHSFAAQLEVRRTDAQAPE